jgi:hypothetical protein
VFTKPYITARLLINTPNSSAIEKEKKKRKGKILFFTVAQMYTQLNYPKKYLFFWV